MMKMVPAIRFRIDFSNSSNLGPGKVELLEQIRSHGSISAAARATQLSYRKAWLLLNSLNDSFLDRVSINTTGGSKGGGVRLTPFGESLIQRYRTVEHRFGEIANEHLGDIQARIKPGASISRRVPVTKKASAKKR